ncbi:hypothetical protein [Pseudonocardia sp. TRM90224]|uniref:hypothetical protein n=1 Tax=Pseudonocardia sp. TRM90224 TaxID=2812678 RepID=UPI001E2CC313|nr:hypothetical protein [Pseudonocardia sp. TRM90224]
MADQLDEALRDLGRVLDTGPVPDVMPEVLSRLAEPRRPRRARWLIGGGFAAIVAVLIGVVPGAASAVGGFFQSLPGVLFSQSSEALPPPGAGRLGEALGLHGPVSLDEARRTLPFPVPLPSSLGEPDEVYLQGARAATLVWRAGPRLPEIGPSGIGLVIDVIDPDRGPIFEKLLTAPPERFDIDGQPAAWTARPHPLVLLDDQGAPLQTRLSTRSLVVVEERCTVRIESVLDREGAIAIAITIS